VPGEHGGVLVCRNCGQTLTADDEGRGCKRCNWYEEWEEGEPSEWVQIVYGDRRPVGINQSERDVRAAESRRTPILRGCMRDLSSACATAVRFRVGVLRVMPSRHRSVAQFDEGDRTNAPAQADH
jgi:hypothetical protein